MDTRRLSKDLALSSLLVKGFRIECGTEDNPDVIRVTQIHNSMDSGGECDSAPSSSSLASAGAAGAGRPSILQEFPAPGQTPILSQPMNSRGPLIFIMPLGMRIRL